jgi:hypothetical protein
MASHIVVGYLSNSLEEVDVEALYSSCCSCEGGVESRSQSLSSQSSMPHWTDDDSVEYCQCSDDEDDTLVECLTCGSWFDLDTYCPDC